MEKQKMNLKKLLCFMFSMILVCSMLTACGLQKFEKANKLYESGDYKEALELYQKLGDYEDAQEKVKACERKIGMMEKADNEFLTNIEESVLDRMKASATENKDNSTLVNIELTRLIAFKDKEFYDDDLKAIADKYIEGLNIQKESLKKDHEYEQQIEWQRGLVYRCEALKALYEKYDFLTDNAEFIGTYVSQYEDEKALLTAYDEIEKDIGEQTKDKNFKWKITEDTISCTIKNNTKYQFSTIFEIYIYDKNGVMYESDITSIEHIKSGDSYVVSFYIYDAYRLESFDWLNYYTDVKY